MNPTEVIIGESTQCGYLGGVFGRVENRKMETKGEGIKN